MSSRLDVMLVNKGLAQSRERAQSYIMAGQVYVNNQKVIKSGDKIKDDDIIEIRGSKIPYVSRGGLKLEKSLKSFDIDLNDKICMDIGASTGGFTDCMLQNGAKKVYSIDVGYGQLAWKLRTDERVVNIERTNIRHIDFDLIVDDIDFISIDVSFISLKLVLPNAYKLLKDGGHLVALIKPQFEAGRDDVGKKGVVRDINVHQKVIANTIKTAFEIGFTVLDIDFSPIKGPEGNIEFLIYLRRENDNVNNVSEDMISAVTNKSHI